MNHPDFDTLMMFLDRELGVERMKEVSHHVESCSRCRNIIDSQRNLETSWRESYVTPEDDKFRSMEWIIYRRIHRRSRWKFFVPAAAGIIAVLLGVKVIMDNEPFKGRTTEYLRESRIDYESYTLRFEYARDESVVTELDGFDSAETAANASIIAPTEGSVSWEDISPETTSESVGYGVASAEPVQQQSDAASDASGECFRGSTSVSRSTDLHAVAGTAGGSGGIGGEASYGYINEEDECEEAFISEEIILGGAAESCSPEEQMNSIDDICTIYLDTVAAGLAVIETVPSSSEICGDTEDGRLLNQSCDYYSGFHEMSDNDMNTTRADIYVELVFDTEGQPDSNTELLLDSLFPGWSDYIPLVYRDTVLVVPLTGISEFFVKEGSTVPAETIE